MVVISDSNIIFSCLYAPEGVIATILTAKKQKIQFIAPLFLLEEVKEHLPTIIEKTNRTKKEVLSLLKKFTKNITFYNESDISTQNIKKAEEIVSTIDTEDAPFVELYLQTGHKTLDKILSNGLKEKGYDICITTTEVKERLYKEK
jgi:hypothetical protein